MDRRASGRVSDRDRNGFAPDEGRRMDRVAGDDANVLVVRRRVRAVAACVPLFLVPLLRAEESELRGGGLQLEADAQTAGLVQEGAVRGCPVAEVAPLDVIAASASVEASDSGE